MPHLPRQSHWPLTFLAGAFVRQKANPSLVGSVVRFGCIPGMWIVRWADGTCRWCNATQLEPLPDSVSERAGSLGRFA